MALLSNIGEISRRVCKISIPIPYNGGLLALKLCEILIYVLNKRAANSKQKD